MIKHLHVQLGVQLDVIILYHLLDYLSSVFFEFFLCRFGCMIYLLWLQNDPGLSSE